MLTLKSIEEVYQIIEENFNKKKLPPINVALLDALGRSLSQNIISNEFVPTFNRSTVDGFALIASDTFGCSDSIPAILSKTKEVFMGEKVDFEVSYMECSPIPTGGQIPTNSDSVQMIEYSEDYEDGTIGILKPTAPGQNIVFKGDDVKPSQIVLKKGRILSSHDIGALAALGYSSVPVVEKPVIGIISTGNELVPIESTPLDGQVRDVNSSLLATSVASFGATFINYGIIKDEEYLLENTLNEALSKCHIVLISGGSSVGTKDATCRVIEKKGEILTHGIALKPGKPTILGNVNSTPVIGLPGHPVAAFYVTQLIVSYLLESKFSLLQTRKEVTGILTESIESNHGRAQCVGVTMRKGKNNQIEVTPVRTKSGLITTLAGTDGYFVIPKNSEGLPQNTQVTVYIYQ